MANNMSYKIGQVIYVLSKETNRILPMIVRDEIYHRSIDGESINYRLGIGPSGNQKVVDLTNVKGESFGTLEEVREYLLNQQTIIVDNVCAEAASRVTQWYGGVTQRLNQQGTQDQGAGLSPDQLLDQVDNQHPPARVNVNQQQKSQTPIPAIVPGTTISGVITPEQHLPGRVQKPTGKKSARDELRSRMMDPEFDEATQGKG